MMHADINGHTQIIAHIGYPTHSFKSPMIYNPWFEKAGVNTVVVPMSCQSADYPDFLPAVFKLGNLRGALITMPHKVVTMGLLDVVSPTALVAGACNAVRLNDRGQLQGDMFDGEGFVRGLLRKGVTLKGAKALVVGSGGVGCAIAASLAAKPSLAAVLTSNKPSAATPLAASDAAIAQPAPPLPTTKAFALLRVTPLRSRPRTKPSPSNMSPCNWPCAFNRTALQAPAINAVGEMTSIKPIVTTLCGMVISAPRIFDNLNTLRKKSG